MIYGNKFYGYGIGDPTDFLGIISADVQTIESLYNNYNEEYIMEMSFKDIFSKFKEALMKILDAISKMVKKAIPFLYDAIQKIIANISNSDKRPRDQIAYDGKKIINLLTIKDDINSVLSDLHTVHFDSELKELHDTYNKLAGNMFKETGAIDNLIKEVNEDIDKISESLEKKVDKFRDFINVDIDNYLEDNEHTVESANDYNKFKDYLNNMIKDNKSMKTELEDLSRSITSDINVLDFSGALYSGVNDKFNMSNIHIKRPNATTFTDICKIYTNVIGIYKKAISSEIKAVNSVLRFAKS